MNRLVQNLFLGATLAASPAVADDKNVGSVGSSRTAVVAEGVGSTNSSGVNPAAYRWATRTMCHRISGAELQNDQCTIPAAAPAGLERATFSEVRAAVIKAVGIARSAAQPDTTITCEAIGGSKAPNCAVVARPTGVAPGHGVVVMDGERDFYQQTDVPNTP